MICDIKGVPVSLNTRIDTVSNSHDQLIHLCHMHVVIQEEMSATVNDGRTDGKQDKAGIVTFINNTLTHHIGERRFDI